MAISTPDTVRSAVAAGRLDGALQALEVEAIRTAVIARMQRDQALRIANMDGASTTPLRLEVAFCDVDADADRSARFASDVLFAIRSLDDGGPVGHEALASAYGLTERSSTSTSTLLVEAESQIVIDSLNENEGDLDGIAGSAFSMRSGSRIRRRLVALALPHVLATALGIGLPLYTPVPDSVEEGDTPDLPRFHAAIRSVCNGGYRAMIENKLLLKSAKARLTSAHKDSRLLDAYAQMLVNPVLTPRLLAPQIGVSTRAASILISKLEASGLAGTMPANRMARKIGICERAIVAPIETSEIPEFA